MEIEKENIAVNGLSNKISTSMIPKSISNSVDPRSISDTLDPRSISNTLDPRSIPTSVDPRSIASSVDQKHQGQLSKEKGRRRKELGTPVRSSVCISNDLAHELILSTYT